MLDNFLRDLIRKEFRIGSTSVTFLDALLAICITGVAVQIRVPVFNYIATSGIAHTEKVIYCVLDFVLALFMAAFVWKVTGNRVKTVGVYAVTVIWPVISSNSALNGGFEVRNAVILLVLLLIIVYCGKMQKSSFIVFSLLACLLQITQGDIPTEKITNFWPNLYALISETGFVEEYGIDGKLLVFAALAIIFYYISKKKIAVTPKLLVSAGLFFSLFISFFYPFMNYRSGFLANVFAILLFFLDRKRFVQPMLLCIVSYVSYAFFYNGELWVPFWFYALILLGLMMDAGAYFYRRMNERTSV